MRRERQRWEKTTEREREKEREVQEVAERVQGSIQPAGLGDTFRALNARTVLHHGSPWHVLLILPLTRRILPCGSVHTKTYCMHTCKTHTPWFFVCEEPNRQWWRSVQKL